MTNGFKHNNADKCIYSKFTKEYGVIICLYVDDLLIFGTNIIRINETKRYLTSQFKMKDMNEVDTILGIKISRHSGIVLLSQSHYIEKILEKFKQLVKKEYTTSYVPYYKLEKNSKRAIA